MGKLELNGMHFYAHHGCFEEERVIGNHFIVDFSATYDMSVAAASDRIEDAVDYPQIYKVIRTEMEIPSNLLENVARRILDRIRSAFPALQSATLSVRKLNPPIGGQVESFGVTMSY